jgi:hypothetical protein
MRPVYLRIIYVRLFLVLDNPETTVIRTGYDK